MSNIYECFNSSTSNEYQALKSVALVVWHTDNILKVFHPCQYLLLLSTWLQTDKPMQR